MSVDTIQRYRLSDIYRVKMNINKAVTIDGMIKQSYSQPRTLTKRVLGLEA